jgi:electron transport complex protein RnfC
MNGSTQSKAMTLPESPRALGNAGSNAFREVLLPPKSEASEPAAVTQPGAVRQMLEQLDPSAVASIVNRLKDAGISLDRWVSPDLLGQLQIAIQRPPKFVLCGAIDLDPALPVQRALAIECAIDIAAGAAALGRLIGTKRVILAVPEDMSGAGVAALRDAAQAASVRLFPVMERYPLAQPSLLIRRTLGRRLLPGKLPTEVGVLMLDAPAALAVARFLIHGEPMRRVPMGIYDETHSRGHLLRVPVGLKLGDVLAAAEISGQSTELWAGHVLRHVPIDRNAIIGSGELTVFASAPRRSEPASACLRCAWCVEACPVSIQPAGLLDAAQQNDPQLAEHYGVRSCIDCGICSYVCPSRLPLLGAIRELRNK